MISHMLKLTLLRCVWFVFSKTFIKPQQIPDVAFLKENFPICHQVHINWKKKSFKNTLREKIIHSLISLWGLTGCVCCYLPYTIFMNDVFLYVLFKWIIGSLLFLAYWFYFYPYLWIILEEDELECKFKHVCLDISTMCYTYTYSI